MRPGGGAIGSQLVGAATVHLLSNIEVHSPGVVG